MARDRTALAVSAAILVLISETAAAQTSGQQTEVLAVVRAALSAAQSGDQKDLRDKYADDCVFIDEFAPYRWSGPNAIDGYFASAAKMYQETQHSDVSMTVGAAKYVYVTGDEAYVVEPLREQAKVKGRAYKSAGSLTFTLRRIGHAWKITSQAWSKTEENINPY
jgi:ketosteroid isomerase-like protein